jgi:hypothetical protein
MFHMHRATVQPARAKKATGAYRRVAQVIALCACLGISACGAAADPDDLQSQAAQPSDGTGYLVAADLKSVHPPHFVLPPAPVGARLVLRDNGCVTVSIDGTQHLPIWPDGTQVTDSTADPGNYTVRLNAGTTLTVNAAEGSTFEASGIVDDQPGKFTSADGVPGKVQQLLDFCGAPGEPVLFPDAATFVKK